MYSAVLMLALTASPDAVGFGHRCHGCTTSYGCTSSYMPGCTSGAPVMMPETGPKKMPETVPPPKAKAQAFAPATIIVSVPAGTRLSVDGHVTTSTTEVRTLVTPALQVGETYTYSLRAEVVNKGQSMVQDQQVSVRGGQTSTIRFNFSSQSVASR